MLPRFVLSVALFSLSALILVPMELSAQTPSEKSSTSSDLHHRLAEYLANTKFVGQFTIEGKDAPPKTEEYWISKCEKLETENMYRLTARIRYGETDREVPLELKIVFAGNTPVITLDEFWIPGMGTFDARVVIRKDRYAGTWQHGEHGGHLFGKIVPIPPPEAEPIDPQSTRSDPSDPSE